MVAALDKIKVVDLTRTLAGPFCTMLMGDMGAEVIKIEEPTGGDETRHWTPFVNGESTQFLTFNRNKRSLAVNLKEPDGLKIVKDLAADADVMIESFRAGTLERLGLGYEEIKKINPGVVYCSISGYGRTGPMSDMPGYDLLIQAYSGLMSLTGDPDGSPLRIGFSLVDLFTGMMAYGTILTALRQRDQTGKGQWVESALLDGQVAALSYHATGFMGTGVERWVQATRAWSHIRASIPATANLSSVAPTRDYGSAWPAPSARKACWTIPVTRPIPTGWTTGLSAWEN